MGCKTRRSKHLFKSKKSLRYRNKKRRTQRGGGEGETPAPAKEPATGEQPAPGEQPAKEEPAPGETLTNEQKDKDYIANTIMSNINKASSIGLQFVNNSVSGVLDGVASKLNIDSSKPALDVASEGATKLGKIASVMGTPEGDELKKKFSNVLVELVDTTKPALDEATKIGEEFVDKSSKVAVKGALDVLGGIPGVGTTVEFVRVLDDAGQAVNASVAAAADLTKVGSDAAIKVHAVTEKAGDLVEEASNLADNANIPSAPLPTLPEVDVPKVPEMDIPKVPQAIQAGGGMRALNQLQKAGKRIENRVESSLKEFNKHTKTRKKVRFNL